MQVTKKDLEKSQIELNVELSAAEMAPYIEKGAQKISETVKIEGFRPGKVPYDILKAKIGEMSILEEAAQIAVSKTLDEIIEKNTIGLKPVGQPNVSITKLAPSNPFEFKVVLSILPDIALGKYKDLGIKPEEVKVEEAEVDKVINDLREMRAAEILEEKEIADGDKAVVDIHIFDGNVPIENGHHHDLAVLIGKNYFVPGFDKKLIGAKAGEELKFELLYPEDHHQKNLAGKMAKFEVKIKAVYRREVPALDDSLAETFRLKNLEDLKKNLQENILQEKGRETELKNEAEMITKIMDDTKIGDLPEILIESESRNIMAELEQSVVRQGGKFEDYLGHLKKTKEELQVELLPNAVKRVKSALIIREIAVVEKITVSDKEIADKIDDLKKQYASNNEVLKMIEEPGYKQYLSNILTNEKILTKLKDWNYAPVSAKQKS
jgi:trigger factor